LKKIILSTLLLLPILSFGQKVAYTSTFDIVWPDESKSTITVNYSGTSTNTFLPSDDFYTLKSDSSIEFNSQKGNEYTHLNPRIDNCQDTNTYHLAIENLYLGKSDGNICTSLPFSGFSEIIFRKRTNPTLKGRLRYAVFQLSTITQLGTIGQELVEFNQYTLNSSSTPFEITETITSIKEAQELISNNVNLSPNPFTSFVQVESTQYANFQLTTVTGKVLKTNLPTNQPIDLSDLESSIYIVQLDNGTIHKRIVKQ
jgi:hypothetical protein